MGTHFRRLVALMLLASPVLEAAVPGLCPSESLRIPTLNSPAEPDSAATPAQQRSPQEQSDPAPEFPGEEDCFCHCAHIVHSSSQEVAVIFISSPIEVATLQSPPTVDLPTYFHPPRS